MVLATIRLRALYCKLGIAESRLIPIRIACIVRHVRQISYNIGEYSPAHIISTKTGIAESKLGP